MEQNEKRVVAIVIFMKPLSTIFKITVSYSVPELTKYGLLCSVASYRWKTLNADNVSRLKNRMTFFQLTGSRHVPALGALYCIKSSN
jgi:hypothetical protein